MIDDSEVLFAEMSPRAEYKKDHVVKVGYFKKCMCFIVLLFEARTRQME